MKPELSIIIPCYNCEKTLEEAIESCYTQGLKDFEIVMVDDGSIDKTRKIMEKIADKHKEIRLFYHDKNQGGGAARNTAVKNSSADLIFCLDSDDILEPNTLKKMLGCMREKKCDGVAFSGAYSFSKDKNKEKKIDFGLPVDEPITLDYLFSKKAWIGGNFLYTRNAFETAGGYPTDHSFDTQGYGFRILANRLIVYPCPGSFLYQRQFSEDVSYFERAYNAGEFSIGHYLMFLQYIHMFSPMIRDIILDYDIFTRYTLEENILSDLQNKYAADKTSFFSSRQDRSGSVSPESEYQKERFESALGLFIDTKKKYRNMYFDGMRYLYGTLNGKMMRISDYKKFLSDNSPRMRTDSLLRLTIYQRIRRKIKKYIQKNELSITAR